MKLSKSFSDNVDLSSLHPGIFHCPVACSAPLMPELKPLFDTAPFYVDERAIIDVKVHMLMPHQWPCIPNWHYDFVPRVHGEKRFELRNPEITMFVLVSGPPLIEFRDGREVRPWTWIPFTQFDEHRGTMSEDFQWRLFARVVPESLCPAAPPEKRLRRHSQVYLDTSTFEW